MLTRTNNSADQTTIFGEIVAFFRRIKRNNPQKSGKPALVWGVTGPVLAAWHSDRGRVRRRLLARGCPELACFPGVRCKFMRKGVIPIVQVVVRDNNVDQALKALKKKMQREGVFREMKLRRSYEKPSEKRAREKAEAVRRQRKLARKRKEREGF
jgi:small subunit ribosomal protein S21